MEVVAASVSKKDKDDIVLLVEQKREAGLQKAKYIRRLLTLALKGKSFKKRGFKRKSFRRNRYPYKRSAFTKRRRTRRWY